MLEFAQFIRILRRSFVQILGIVVAGGVIGYAALTVVNQTQTASAVASLRFEGVIPSPANTIAYDGYYVVETERRFGQLLGDALMSEKVKDRLLAESGSAIVRVERITPVDFTVQFHLESPNGLEAADVLERTLSDALADRAARSGEPVRFSVSVGDLEIHSPRSPWWGAAIGLAVGFILGIFVVLLREYFRGIPEP